MGYREYLRSRCKSLGFHSEVPRIITFKLTLLKALVDFPTGVVNLAVITLSEYTRSCLLRTRLCNMYGTKEK
jgi:hypothetical protein